MRKTVENREIKRKRNMYVNNNNSNNKRRTKQRHKNSFGNSIKQKFFFFFFAFCIICNNRNKYIIIVAKQKKYHQNEQISRFAFVHKHRIKINENLCKIKLQTDVNMANIFANKINHKLELVKCVVFFCRDNICRYFGIFES